MPHGHCYLWQPPLISLHVIADGLIAISYMSIPVTLLHIVRRRRDIPFDWIFLCFSLFIVACGVTHALEIWTLWRPDYWISGFAKALTAGASVATAVLLIRLVPTVLKIPSPRTLEDAHRALRLAHEQLEERVEARTTELMRTNAELASEHAERTRLESISQAKTQFLSSMSHELRTPLNAILGFAQLLQREKREPVSDRNRERVAQILQAGEHLLHLIDELLDMSRIEAGTTTIALDECSVSEAVAHVKTTLESLAASREVALNVEPLALSVPDVTADRTRFAQVLINFASNAIKYNRRHGSVTFSACELASGSVRISVRDNGLGIPADKQGTVFAAFERAGREGGPIEGTGLGLFITKRLAELMHGAVGFRSTAGEGSEFWIDLPVGSSSRVVMQPEHAD